MEVQAEDVLRHLVVSLGQAAEERGICEDEDLDAIIEEAQRRTHQESYGEIGLGRRSQARMLGVDVSHSEVTNISAIGFWLLVDDREYFVPFSDYPAFNDATVAQIYNVERLGPRQFFWPDLDVDIELGVLQRPEQFPLQFKIAT